MKNLNSKNQSFFFICLSLILITSCGSTTLKHQNLIDENYPAIKLASRQSIKPIDDKQILKLLPNLKGKIKFSSSALVDKCMIGNKQYSVLSTMSKTLGNNLWIKEVNNPKSDFVFLQTRGKLISTELCTAKSVCIKSLMAQRGVEVDVSFCLKTTASGDNCKVLLDLVQCKDDKDC